MSQLPQQTVQNNKRNNTSCAQNLVKIGTLNCRGLNNDLKLKQLATDFEEYKLDILAIQETHLKETEITEIKPFNGNSYKLFCSSKKEAQNTSFTGVGFVTKSDFDGTFTPISDRICYITKRYKDTNCIFVSAYAPTLPRSERCPEEREEFYEQLDGIIKSNENKGTIFVCGDFNAKTGSSQNLYKENMGKFGKGKSNENGNFLLDFAQENRLILTNTLFEHKQAHRTTWTSKQFTDKTVRNQIDYILCQIPEKINVIDSRSYSGIFLDTDHYLVITKVKMERNIKRTYKRHENKQINIENLKSNVARDKYKLELDKELKTMESKLETKEIWTNICKVITDTSVKILGNKRSTTKSTNIEIVNLSKKQKDLKCNINSCKDTGRKSEMKKERNAIMHEIKYKLKIERSNKELQNIEEIAESKDNTAKMFKSVKKQYREKPKEKIFVKKGNKIIQDDHEVTKEVTKFFEEMFNSEAFIEMNEIKPTKMENPFNTNEIKKAINKLKNNKSPGPDEIYAEQLKHAPDTLSNIIADLFNKMAETGAYPDEISEGLLIPIQKPGKEKGKIQNLRPIILLNMLRKILAIVILERVFKKLDNEIPLTQSAYRPGRSTTENVFTMKILAEKAITESNTEINILLFDMSKAFDNVNRNILLKDLEKVVNKDELHILKILTADVKLQVLNNKIKGDKFKTSIGVPQGDCLSPILFTFYLANALKEEGKNENIDHNYSSSNKKAESLLPKHIVHHNYAKKQKMEIDLNQQFADDIGYISTSKSNNNEIKDIIPNVLKNKHLTINEDKTEQYSISKNNDDENWKKCKYLGSYLDTETDISRRKILAIQAYNKYKHILESNKIFLSTRKIILNTLVMSIFLYNSELWTLTKKIETSLDIFHRKILKRMLQIFWPKKMSNKRLYEICNEEEVSKTIKRRRLRWTGHLLRLPESTPAKNALQIAGKHCKGNRRTCKKTWIKNVNTDLASIDTALTIHNTSTHVKAQDRMWWRQNVVGKKQSSGYG